LTFVDDDHKRECESKTKRAFTRSQSTASLAEINKSALTDHANQENHTINWSKATVIDRARPSYQVDQGGHTHPQGRSTIHESRWGQLSTQSCIWPLSWHVKFKFSSCQEPEELVPASSSDEGLW